MRLDEDAAELGDIGRLKMRVISPVDLAVSKIGRFLGNDEQDIAELAKAGLLSPDDVERRCSEALRDYIGVPTLIQYNLRDALEIVRSCRR